MDIPSIANAADRPCVPLYEQLADSYREAILDHRLLPGQRVDSINRIQRIHGVSRDTAKRALSILREEGYILQRPGMGSFVADVGPKQAVWGVVVPFFSVAYEHLLTLVRYLAAPHGRELRFFYSYNNWEEEVRLVKMMLDERYEAIVVIPTLDESRTWSFYSRLSPSDAPVILFDHTMTYRDFHFVVQSYDLGVVRAMDYLIDRAGHRVAFLANEEWSGRNLVLELMTETYRMVLGRRCPDFEPVLFERAAQVDAEVLRAKGIRGVFCCDDVSAIRIIGQLREQGVSVPGDIRVVSYGNTDLARFFTPAITSVDPHNDEMAAYLVDVVQAVLRRDASRPLMQYVVQPELVVRET